MLQQFDEKNRDLIVYVNGRLAHRDEAGVSPFDSSVQNGDAVWEGLRLYDGRIFRLTEHLARLRRSAVMLQYRNIPGDAQIIEALRQTLAANAMTDGVHIRLMLTRGIKYTSGLDPRVNLGEPTLIVLAEHKPPVFNKAGIRLILSTQRRPSPHTLNQHIHSANQITSILAKLQANAAGVDDALLLDEGGFIAETSSTHVFIVKAGAVHTPTTFACPEGITRGVVLELCEALGIEATVRDIEPQELYNADEMFCTGTMGELAPVVEVDGRALPADGAITHQLAERFAELTQREGERVVGA